MAEPPEGAPEADQPAPAPDQAPPVSPEEEQLRAQLEEQLRELRIEDLILQSAVSILNLSARRIAKDDERDLAQAKAGIEAAGALVEHTPEQARSQLREAVSELQLLYAKHAGEGEGGAEPAQPPTADPNDQSTGASRLWTPGSE